MFNISDVLFNVAWTRSTTDIEELEREQGLTALSSPFFDVPECVSCLIDGIVSEQVLLFRVQHCLAEFFQIVRFTLAQEFTRRYRDIAKQPAAGGIFNARDLGAGISSRVCPRQCFASVTFVFPSCVRCSRLIFDAVRPTFSFWQRDKNNSKPNIRISWPYRERREASNLLGD